MGGVGRSIADVVPSTLLTSLERNIPKRTIVTIASMRGFICRCTIRTRVTPKDKQGVSPLTVVVLLRHGRAQPLTAQIGPFPLRAARAIWLPMPKLRLNKSLMLWWQG